MERLLVRPGGPLSGVLRVPGDKSISHRALLLGGLAEGTTRITGLLDAEDVGRTLAAVRALGARVERVGDEVHVQGAPWSDVEDVDCGNSGTTARLLLGALAGRAGARLHGDASLSARPMRRVRAPLEAMGACFEGGDTLPLRVRRAAVTGITWEARVASAQVKSAVLLAGLCAAGETTYVEPVATRDHTERMLRAMGAPIHVDGDRISVRPGAWSGIPLAVPGDLSSAAFPLAAALLIAGGEVAVDGVGLNPARTGVLDAWRAMGVDLDVRPAAGFEPVGRVTLRGGAFGGATIAGSLVPRLIDELPLLAVLAAFADGVTEIRDAQELRVKESDRIATVAVGLRAMGAEFEERPDGLRIEGRGGAGLRGASVASGGDHRIAMAFAVAGVRVGMEILDAACVRTSYPAFANNLCSLGASVEWIGDTRV